MRGALLLVAILAGPAWAADSTPQFVPRPATLSEELLRASRLDESGDPAAALDIAERLLEGHHESESVVVELLERIGFWARRAGQRGKKRSAERRLEALRPQTATVLIARSRLRRGDGDFAGAQALAAKAAALSPARVDVYVELSEARVSLGKFDAAIEALRAGIAANPGSGTLHVALASLLRQQGRFDEAIALYAEARRVEPALLSAYFEEGYARLARGEGVKALEIMHEGVRASSGNPVAHHHLGTSLWTRGKYTEGLAEMEKARQIFEASPGSTTYAAGDYGHTLNWLAIMHEHLKIPDYLELQWQSRRMWNPNDPGNAILTIRQLEAQHKYEEARAEADRWIDGCAKMGCDAIVEARLLAQRAKTLQHLGQASDASRDLEKALDLVLSKRAMRASAGTLNNARLAIAFQGAAFYAEIGDLKRMRVVMTKIRPTVDLTPGAPLAVRYRTMLQGLEKREKLRREAHERVTPQRGVILISVDALRADRVGARRGETPLTPTLDGLSRSGVVFTNAVSQAPWTLPSMGTLFTSLMPTQHTLTNRFKTYQVENRELARLPSRVSTLAEAFKRAGFDTAAFTGDAALDGEYGFDRGFDVYYDSTSFAGFEITAPMALDWLRERGAKPFFLFLHGYDAHGQNPVEPGFRSRFAEPGYQGNFHGTIDEFLEIRKEALYGQPRPMTASDRSFWTARYDERVARADERLGRFFAELERLPGISTSVIVAVTSDHGEELFERGSVDHGATLYDELLRVPLIIRAPHHPARRIEAQVRSLDVAPTLLDLAGVRDETFLVQAQGATLRPLMEGKTEAGREAPAETDFLYRVSRRSLREPGGRKLIADLETLRYELYDLRDDPGETKDLAPAFPEQILELERRLHIMLGAPYR